MASYFIQILDNLNGSFNIASCLRGSTGGQSLLPVRSGGDAVGTTTGWTIAGSGGGFQGNIAEVAGKLATILAADRALNG